MEKKFCPFINATCKEGCTFFRRAAMSRGATTCLIAAKLDSINEMQPDQINEVIQILEKKK